MKLCEQCKEAPCKKKGRRFCSPKCVGIYVGSIKKSTIPSCHPDRKHEARGMCSPCYSKWQLHERPHLNEAKLKREKKRYEDNKNQPGFGLKRRDYTLRYHFDITQEQWENLFKLQEGVCPICTEQLYQYGNVEGKRSAAVDHDHITGEVRGLLCHQCNVSKIGSNTVETATRVLNYLIRTTT